MFQRLNENKDLIVVAIASFLIGFGAASFFGESPGNGVALAPDVNTKGQNDDLNMPLTQDKDQDTKIDQDVVSPVPGGDAIQVENQRAGSAVRVQRAELAQARWIVVREKLGNGDAGNILGAKWLAAGTHTDVDVKLLRGTVGGEEYYIVIFTDEGGDKKFDHEADKPLMTAAGSVVQATFMTIASPTGS